MNADEWKTVLFWKSEITTLVAAVVGFAGVIITVVVQGRQQRKLARQQFEIQEKAQLEAARNYAILLRTAAIALFESIDYECKVFASLMTRDLSHREQVARVAGYHFFAPDILSELSTLDSGLPLPAMQAKADLISVLNYMETLKSMCATDLDLDQAVFNIAPLRRRVGVNTPVSFLSDILLQASTCAKLLCGRLTESIGDGHALYAAETRKDEPKEPAEEAAKEP